MRAAHFQFQWKLVTKFSMTIYKNHALARGYRLTWNLVIIFCGIFIFSVKKTKCKHTLIHTLYRFFFLHEAMQGVCNPVHLHYFRHFCVLLIWLVSYSEHVLTLAFLPTSHKKISHRKTIQQFTLVSFFPHLPRYFFRDCNKLLLVRLKKARKWRVLRRKGKEYL